MSRASDVIGPGDESYAATQPRTVSLALLCDSPLQMFANRLTAREQGIAGEFRVHSARAAYVAGVVAGRLLVGRCYGIDPWGIDVARHCPVCGHVSHGIPIAEVAGGVPIAVSHSEGSTMVAVGGPTRIGLDYEHLGPDHRSVPGCDESCTSGDQAAGVNFRTEEAARKWVDGEAVAKYLGTGLGYSFTNHRIEPTSDMYRRRVVNHLGMEVLQITELRISAVSQASIAAPTSVVVQFERFSLGRLTAKR